MFDDPTVPLSNGIPMPRLGLGTYDITGVNAAALIRSSLDAGYRLIDTAASYDNEAAVGEGIRQSSVPRARIFVTTKIRRRTANAADARASIRAARGRLTLEQIDLVLLHGPNEDREVAIDAWRGLLQAQEDGEVAAVGVSNFSPAQIQQLFDATEHFPAVSQVQLSPAIQRREDIDFYRGHGIVPMAWSPLGVVHGVLEDPAIGLLAAKHRVSSAVIAIRWGLQRGHVVIPKSGSPAHQRENLRALEITLDENEMHSLDSLDVAAQSAWESANRLAW